MIAILEGYWEIEEIKGQGSSPHKEDSMKTRKIAKQVEVSMFPSITCSFFRFDLYHFIMKI